MIRVVVNDASCLIDLQKGQLLHVLLRLPHRFIVPLPIRREELLDITPQEWRILEDSGMETYDLTGEQMTEAVKLRQEISGLSANDCIALVTTAYQENGVLLTGDGQLRKVAPQRGVRVHGVLWVIDQLEAEEVCEFQLLIDALENWREDRAVFLPTPEIDQRLRRLRSKRLGANHGPRRHLLGSGPSGPVSWPEQLPC